MEKVNVWLTLAANVGVLLGIVFLAAEINNNTEMMRAQINQSRADLAHAAAESQFNSEYIPAIFAKVADGEELSREEQFRYGTWFRGSNRSFDNQLYQFNEGLLGDQMPRDIEIAVRVLIGGSAYSRQVWNEQKQLYSDEYIRFVDGIISDGPR